LAEENLKNAQTWISFSESGQNREIS